MAEVEVKREERFIINGLNRALKPRIWLKLGRPIIQGQQSRLCRTIQFSRMKEDSMGYFVARLRELAFLNRGVSITLKEDATVGRKCLSMREALRSLFHT